MVLVSFMKLSTLVGGRIKALRKAKGWTQEQLAEASSLHYSYVGGVERGETKYFLGNAGESRYSPASVANGTVSR